MGWLAKSDPPEFLTRTSPHHTELSRMQKDSASKKLAEAASLTKKTQLKALLSKWPQSLNAVDAQGAAPLHYACELKIQLAYRTPRACPMFSYEMHPFGHELKFFIPGYVALFPTMLVHFTSGSMRSINCDVFCEPSGNDLLNTNESQSNASCVTRNITHSELHSNRLEASIYGTDHQGPLSVSHLPL